MGFSALLAAAGIDEMHFLGVYMQHAPAHYAIAPTDERNLWLSTLVMAMIRRRAFGDDVYVLGSTWNFLGRLCVGRPHVAKHQLDLGVHALGLVELRKASPMDWVSLSRDPSGRFGAVLYALHIASMPSPLVPVAEITAMSVESGFLQASLAVLKAAEVLGDTGDVSVGSVFFVCVLKT